MVYLRNMYYVIDKPALLESIKEEVSVVADAAYTEDGTSLYDLVMVTARDKHLLENYIDDAVNQFVRRAYDITKPSPDVHYHLDEGGNTTDQVAYVIPRLEFHVPDFDTTMTGELKWELDRYIVLFACSAIFQQRRATLVPEYSNRTQTAMDKAITLLKSRKNPITQW